MSVLANQRTVHSGGKSLTVAVGIGFFVFLVASIIFLNTLIQADID